MRIPSTRFCRGRKSFEVAPQRHVDALRVLQIPVPPILNLHGLQPVPHFLGQPVQIAFCRLSDSKPIPVVQEGPVPFEPVHFLHRQDGVVQSMGADLLILDHNMPGMTGAETLQRMKARWPSLPVILSTGNADASLERIVAGTQRVWTLSKPYTRVELQALLSLATN